MDKVSSGGFRPDNTLSAVTQKSTIAESAKPQNTSDANADLQKKDLPDSRNFTGGTVKARLYNQQARQAASSKKSEKSEETPAADTIDSLEYASGICGPGEDPRLVELMAKFAPGIGMRAQDFANVVLSAYSTLAQMYLANAHDLRKDSAVKLCGLGEDPELIDRMKNALPGWRADDFNFNATHSSVLAY